MKITDLLGKQRLIADGGTGTWLQTRGLVPGELPDLWNLTHPEELIALHSAYIEAGANMLTTNTFGANPLRITDDLEKITEAGVLNACKAREMSGRENVFVGLDIGPSGHLLRPMGDLDFEEAVNAFGRVIRSGAPYADYIMIETMSDSLEAKAAVLAAKENCDLPVFITLIFDGSGKLLTGGTPASSAIMLEGLGVDAVGVNCGLGPDGLLPAVEEMLRTVSIPVIANPNAGLPSVEDGRTVYKVTPEEFAQEMRKIAEAGASVVGGCCGTTPVYIRALSETVSSIPFHRPSPEKKTVLGSFCSVLSPEDKPLLIGERINPTGKKRLQEALRAGDTDYILSEAIRQEEAGAQILDVNVGLPGIDEAGFMRKAVTLLQSVTTLPLQLDSSDPEALEAGLRVYNGKALINSVNGKEEVMRSVFPLVKKYGGLVVALPLDENGIPETAEGRIAIAQKIIARAEEYGIPRTDIVLDGLAMTVSADQRMADTALRVIRCARKELGLHTILGVSNISFGLPCRPILNGTFFTMALTEGLSFGIINPCSEEMMQPYRAFCALMGYDRDCADYIAYYKDRKMTAAPSSAPAEPGSAAAAGDTEAHSALSDAILRGLAGPAAEEAKKLLAFEEPMRLIEEELVPALDIVGRKYEEGTLYLPQLLRSAEAAQAAFALIREKIPQGSAKKGRVLIATVEGDIHDIGKNIVKVLLENYSYDVLDLGKDVPPEVIAETAVRENIKLVGLSALMTTTVTAMEKTIQELRRLKPETKIVVGGAVLTEAYAKTIGADAYAKDGMATVRYADSVFGN